MSSVQSRLPAVLTSVAVRTVESASMAPQAGAEVVLLAVSLALRPCAKSPLSRLARCPRVWWADHGDAIGKPLDRLTFERARRRPTTPGSRSMPKLTETRGGSPKPKWRAGRTP